MNLYIFWFWMLGLLLAGYAILDGFDLGVGMLHPFFRGDEERRLVLNSIGPLWDGNEVWLVTFGGALFAAFPRAYATLLSGFYLPFMALLFCLIGRAISIEFRSKRPGRFWRAYWDGSFFLSSALAAFLMGVAVGNVLQGVPVRPDGELVSTWLGWLGVYPAAVGALAVSACAAHGALYLYLKTEGALQQRVRRGTWYALGVFLVVYVLVTLLTLAMVPHATDNLVRWPWTWSLVVFNVLAVANIPRALFRGQPRYAFASSCATIAALTALLGLALYPNLLVSSLDSMGNLTIFNAASSLGTLKRMRLIAFLGMPFVLAYTGLVYWVFRGKVKLDTFSY